MKKRLFAAFLAFTLVMGLGACGSGGNDKDPENGQKPGVEEGVDQDQDETVTDDAIDSPTDDAIQSPDSGSGTANGGTAGSGSAGGNGSTAKPPATTPGTGKPSTGKPDTSKPALSGTPEEIIKKVYDKVGLDLNVSNTEVNKDNMQYYLGATDLKFKKAVASEPMMSSVAHSVVIVQVEDGADIASMKKKIKENVDGRKWICVGVEDEDILVDNVGNYIMLVMDDDAQSFMDAFLALGK